MARIDPVAVANDARNTHNYANPADSIDGDNFTYANSPSFVGATFRALVFDLGSDVTVHSVTAKIDHCGTGSPSPGVMQYATAASPTSWTSTGWSRTSLPDSFHRFDFTAPVGARYIAIGFQQASGFNCATKFFEVFADGDAIPTPPPPDPLPAIKVEIDGVEFTGLREQTIRVALNDAGSFFFAINRHDEQATEANIYRGAIVQVTIPQIHDEVLWEGILETGDFDLLKTDEEGAEWLSFGGPGTMAILKRAVMDFTQYEGAVPEVFPSKGYWEFSNSAGNRTEGDIIRRIVDEAEAAARPGTPVPEISRTFTDDADTDNVPWEDEAFEGSWRIPIGANVYDEVIRLANGGFVMVDFAPGLVMNAYRDFGRDLTSTTFATDKIRFVKGVNIVDDLARSMLGASWATRAIVKKADGEYVRAAISGTFEYEQEAYLESNSDNTNTARREAQGQMRLREDAQEAFLVNIVQPLTFQERDWTEGPDGTVKYLPGPEWSDRGQYWVGDLITLHTGTGDFEYDNVTQRIHAITISINEDTGELAVPAVELNAPYRRPGQDGDLTPLGGPSASTGSSGGGSAGSGAHVHTGYQPISDKGQADGYAALDDDANVPANQLAQGTPDAGDTIVYQADGTRAWELGGEAAVFDALDWFNVEDYGAVHDGVTDDRDAIQAAIDAVHAAGGGTLYFPRGTYLLAGALVDTGTYNSQLKIPQTDAPAMTTFRFLGEHATLKSTWDGTISGNPSIISAGTHDSLTLNSVFVVFERMRITYKANPKLSAIDMTKAATFRIRGTLSMAPYESYFDAVPTHSNAVGVDLPWGLNDQNSGGDALWVDGMYTALRPSEQMVLQALYPTACAEAVEMRGATGAPEYLAHSATIQRLNVWFCVRGIRFSGDIRTLFVADMDVEHNDPIFTTIYDIDDPSNYARGFIALHTTDYVTGEPVDDHLINGAIALSIHNAAFGRWKLANEVDIPTGSDPVTNPTSGFRLYAASATGKPTTRSSAGTVTTIMREGDTAGGDLSGTYPNPSVVDDSHSHTSATAPGGGTGGGDHSHIVDEVFSGDGSTTAFELANEAVPDSVMAWVSGTRTPVTLSADLLTITFGVAPAAAADNISVDYAAATS